MSPLPVRVEPDGPPDAVRVFAALGDRTRFGIVERLRAGGSMSIQRLTEDCNVSRQAVTKHLQVLARAGLVRHRRRGRERLWRLEPRQLAEARRCLDRISQQWDAGLERLRRYVER
ncbi:metalloregulator ArsR/SmtB family transcription factor [soil metagenome]